MAFLWGLLGFMAGAIFGGLVALGLSIAAAEIFSIPQFEGAYAMGVVFVYIPLGALIGGVIGAAVAVWRTWPKTSSAGPESG